MNPYQYTLLMYVKCAKSQDRDISKQLFAFLPRGHKYHLISFCIRETVENNIKLYFILQTAIFTSRSQVISYTTGS